MSGCLVGLIWNLMIALGSAIIRMLGFLLMLIAISVSSLFVGPTEAIRRISGSWMEQSAGRGVNIGYNPRAREGTKLAAGLMLVVGWLFTIVAVYLIVTVIVK